MIIQKLELTIECMPHHHGLSLDQPGMLHHYTHMDNLPCHMEHSGRHFQNMGHHHIVEQDCHMIGFVSLHQLHMLLNMYQHPSHSILHQLQHLV